MYWNGYCLYALMCFLSPRIDLDPTGGMCPYYNSEDVDRESLVLDVTQWIGDSRYPDICMKSRKFHTILIYAPENITTAQYMRFELDSIDYHHLIILNEASPIDSGGIKGKKTKWGTSLIIHKNSQLMSWRWLRFNKFKHVRIDSCSLIDRGLRIEDLILSRRLLTLTLVNVENLDPWGGIKYYEAPDLRELTINHFNIPFLRKKISKGDLKQLRRLNLANNHIEILEPGFFDSMDRLVLINLEGNQLKTFDHTFDSWPRGVLLDGNPLQGDAQTCRFLKKTTFAYFSDTNRICQKKGGKFPTKM